MFGSHAADMQFRAGVRTRSIDGRFLGRDHQVRRLTGCVVRYADELLDAIIHHSSLILLLHHASRVELTTMRPPM